MKGGIFTQTGPLRVALLQSFLHLACGFLIPGSSLCTQTSAICRVRSLQINACLMTLLPKEACHFTPQLRHIVEGVHNCQSGETNWGGREEINMRQNKGRRCVKENDRSTSPHKNFRLCLSLIPLQLKLMTAATRKWLPSPAACLCVSTFNYTTLNSPFPFRTKDRCGSQPASLNQVQERRRPLKAHQSESYLPLGKCGKILEKLSFD